MQVNPRGAYSQANIAFPEYVNNLSAYSPKGLSPIHSSHNNHYLYYQKRRTLPEHRHIDIYKYLNVFDPWGGGFVGTSGEEVMSFSTRVQFFSNSGVK